MGWVLVVSALCAVQLTSSSYLLPGDVTPSQYDVTLLYDIEPSTNFSAYGVVEILVKAIKPTTKIVLHMQDLTLNQAQSTLTGEDPPIIKSTSLNETYNLLTLELDRPLKKNAEYLLTLPFSGNLKPGLDGVYISSYNSMETRSKEYLVATQFEAISARKGFPCFDEPLHKATFRITIGHHNAFTAASNMPLEKTSTDNALEAHWPWATIRQTFKRDLSEYVFDRFQSSVPMSTYLVAFVISKFKYVESQPGLSTTLFKIWARGDAIDQTSYAADIGPRVLTHFEQWFNVTFPLPKQDMIAIPDFSAGAMENWGLITYRETALLYDKTQSSFLNKERVAEVIAHELAHQWFGNLVTMKWWSDLWLNEGFATFAASVGVAAVEPHWHADRSYAVDNIMAVLGLDALESSHPVSAPIDDPKRISEIFDEISYRKGSTLIRMMTMFLGDKVFKEAIHNYLVKYSYSNAEQDDLWAELTAVSRKHNALSRNVTVKDIMDTWTTQTGYPILEVERDYGSKSLTVTQKRYLALGTKATSSVSWWVPLSVMCEDEAQPFKDAPLQWLSAEEGVGSRHQFEHGAASDQWVLFNPDMIALYRVNYDERNWRLLSDALTGEQLSAVPVLGRVQLLSDAFELAWTNRLNYTIALQLASYLQRETEYLPLDTGLRALAKIENVIKRSPDYGAFQKYVRKLVGEAYVKTGGLYTKTVLNEDDLNSVKMQVLMSGWACRMKVPGCEENAIELYQQWMEEADPDQNNPIPIDLRRTVYCVAISRGSVREWRFALARRQRANVAAVRDMLLGGLACTREVWILNQFLEWSITDGTEIRRQDSAAVIVGVVRSTVGYYVARDFIYTRIKDIYAAFNNQGRRLGFIIKTLLDQFTKQEELDEFLVWLKANEKYLTEATLSVSQAVERARVNIAWLARNRAEVVAQLRERAA